MKQYLARIFQACTVAIAALHGIQGAQSPGERSRIEQLVVMIRGPMGGAETIGAGIIFGVSTESDRLYIATANHVVRRGTMEAQKLQVQFRWLPGDPVTATLLTHRDASLDLAVLAITGLERIRVRPERPPFAFDQLGDTTSIGRGNPVYPLGYPHGDPWIKPVTAAPIAHASVDSITFQTSFLSAGYSGGALLNGQFELIGMVRRDEPPNGEAANIDRIVEKLTQWGYPVELSRAPSPPPDGPCARARIVSPAGSKDRQGANDFPVANEVAIAWEPPDCPMVVQSYQHDNPVPVLNQNDVRSGTRVRIGEPNSGRTEIKIWGGADKPADAIWAYVAADTRACSIELREPKEGAHVGAEAEISGTATIPPSTYLWVLLHKRGVAVWWPQGQGHANIEGRDWYVNVTFADPAPAVFEIKALVVDEPANRTLENWYREGETTGRYPGMHLPPVVEGCSPVQIRVIKAN